MKLSATKINRAFSTARVFKGDATRAHIMRNINPNAAELDGLTSRQLAAVIEIANRSYHDGKSETGASFEDDCVWIGRNVQKLIPVQALNAMDIKKEHNVPKLGWEHRQDVKWGRTTYSLTYQEWF